jgi:hypothetical protein
MRYPLFLVCCVAFACSHPRPIRAGANIVDTTITFVERDASGGTFPQIRDSSKIVEGSIRASVNAPVCNVTATADTVGWPRVATTIPSRYLRAVSIRLPPSFTPHPIPYRSDTTEGSTKYWQHILGSWHSFQGTWPDFRPAGLAFWIGPTEGYPQAGIGGDHVEQVAYAECWLQTVVGRIPITLFAVRSHSHFLSGYYVITYWEIAPRVYVQASGNGPDSLTQAQLLAALATITVTR